MSLTINILIYSIAYFYISIAALNFFYPITKLASIVVFCVSIILSIISAIRIPCDTFVSKEKVRFHEKRWVIGIFSMISIWFVLAGLRPTMDTDANIYHLPLSLLMNHSIWYPGIGKISQLFGFPNGNSVLASMFTSYNVIGLENIPNLLIWFLYGTGIFVYLTRKNIGVLVSFIVSLVFILTPDIFWQSYNMGSDLGCACFITFGLIALSDKKIDEAFLFFTLSSLFKPLGLIAAFVTLLYIMILRVFNKSTVNFFNAKTILAFLLLLFYLSRVYIATGNPVYPFFCLKFAGWGIDPLVQQGLVNRMRGYVEIKYTLSGILIFLRDFLFWPYRVKGSYWFWPFLLGVSVPCIYLYIKEKQYRKIDYSLVYTSVLAVVLFAVWFTGNPLFRFISGVFVFIALKLFIFSCKANISKLLKAVVYTSMIFTLVLFIFNAGKHLIGDVMPIVFNDVSTARLLPFNSNDFKKQVTMDGFVYFKSSNTYCGRVKAPCLSTSSVGNEKFLIQEYKKYNHL